jgi:hypothetical protein
MLEQLSIHTEYLKIIAKEETTSNLFSERQEKQTKEEQTQRKRDTQSAEAAAKEIKTENSWKLRTTDTSFVDKVAKKSFFSRIFDWS